LGDQLAAEEEAEIAVAEGGEDGRGTLGHGVKLSPGVILSDTLAS